MLKNLEKYCVRSNLKLTREFIFRKGGYDFLWKVKLDKKKNSLLVMPNSIKFQEMQT